MCVCVCVCVDNINMYIDIHIIDLLVYLIIV